MDDRSQVFRVNYTPPVAAAGEVHVFECVTCDIVCRVKPAETVDLAVMRREVDLALRDAGCTHTGGVVLRFEAAA